MLETTSTKLNVLFGLTAVSLFYFLLFPFFLEFLGIIVPLAPYYSELSSNRALFEPFVFSSLLFIVYMGVMIWFMFNKNRFASFKPIFKSLKGNADFYFVIFLGISSFLLFIEAYGDTRNEFKKHFNFFNASYLYASLALISWLGERLEGVKSAVALAVILILAILIPEREIALIFSIAVLIKLSLRANPRTLIKLIPAVLVLTYLMVFYKYFLNYFTGGTTTFVIDDIFHFLRILGIDSIHSFKLIVSYFDIDNLPNYNNVSLLIPYQFLNLFDFNLTSNGRIASEFYTNNETGTGFNHALEVYINFGWLGLVFPFIVIPITVFISRLFPFLIPLLGVFVVKFSRGDFWNSAISYVLLPCLVIVALLVFAHFVKKYLLGLRA